LAKDSACIFSLSFSVLVASQFQPLSFNIFHEFRQADPVTYGIIYNLIFGLSKPLGGILFGVAFWIIAKRLGSIPVRNYMIISAYGLLLLFTSNQAIILVNFNYPPFGLATVSFMGLSSYLVLVGIYSAAISVSQDVNLRRSIRKSVLNEARLLDNIGSAEMERQIVQEVFRVAKRNEEDMKQETGLSTSIQREEILGYLDDILREIKSKKESKSD
jgi:hypothetical protein